MGKEAQTCHMPKQFCKSSRLVNLCLFQADLNAGFAIFRKSCFYFQHLPMPECSWLKFVSVINTSCTNTVLNPSDRLEKVHDHKRVIVFISEGKARQF